MIFQLISIAIHKIYSQLSIFVCCRFFNAGMNGIHILPEMMAILLYVDVNALEHSEGIFIEDVRQVHRIMADSDMQIYLEQLDEPRKVCVSR